MDFSLAFYELFNNQNLIKMKFIFAYVSRGTYGKYVSRGTLDCMFHVEQLLKSYNDNGSHYTFL